MSAYLLYPPSGVPGDVTRVDESMVEPARLIAISSVYAQAFGIPVKYATGGISQIASGDAATVFAGVLVREVPSISGSVTAGLTDNIPNPNQIAGFCARGFVNVLCKVGTPTRGGIVYMRVIAATNKLVGDFEADSDSSNSVVLPYATWASDGKDADNNAELRINIPH